MKLVDNWRQAFRWFSVQAMAALAIVPVVWPMIPTDLKEFVPPGWGPYILAAVAVGGIAGRLVDQKKDTAP